MHQSPDCKGVWIVAERGDSLVCTGCDSTCPFEPWEMMGALRENSLALMLADLASQGRQMRERGERPMDH